MLTRTAANPLRRVPRRALLLSTCLLLCSAAGADEEFSARGVPGSIASDSAGRVTFQLLQQDPHYWIEPLPERERAALLAALRALAHERRAVIVYFGILGAGIPDGHPWLEYRAQRLRPLASPTDLYGERTGAAPRARPELRADSPLDIALLRGVPLFHSDRFDEAERRLNVAAQAADAEGAGSWKRILAYKYRGLTRAARARADDASERSDSDRDLVAALEDLREWQRLEPGSARAQYEIGLALEALGAYRDALGVYAGIARGWPVESFWASLRTAAAYRAMRDYTHSLAALDGIRREDRDSMPYHYQRGWTLEASGSDADAIAEYSAGLKVQPDYPWAFLRRACAQVRTGQRAEALADGRSAVGILAAYPAQAQAAQRDLAASRRIVAQLEDGAGEQAVALCESVWRRDAPRARSELLAARLEWLPLSRTPPRARGLYALTPTQFRLLVLAVLALVAGAAVVLLRHFTAPR